MPEMTGCQLPPIWWLAANHSWLVPHILNIYFGAIPWFVVLLPSPPLNPNWGPQVIYSSAGLQHSLCTGYVDTPHKPNFG